jgi:zinc transporter 9
VSSRRAVYTALAADLTLAVAKLAAWALTGSASMLSETVHSFADSANQALLVVGMRRSQRAADAKHPYGYGRERFVWALISAVGILFIGCGATLAHGVRRLLEPHPVDHPQLAIAILLLSLVLEGISLATGLRAVGARARERGVSIPEALRSDGDTLAIAVVLEDSAAVLGATFALAALAATWLTGDPRFDAVGSIVIALLLGASATFLAHRNRSFLLGVSAPAPMRARLLAVLEAAPVVEEVKDVKVTVLGPDAIRFKAEVEFDGAEVAKAYLDELSPDDLRALRASDESAHAFLVHFADRLVDALGDAVDDLEDELRAEVPQARHVDLEAD